MMSQAQKDNKAAQEGTNQMNTNAGTMHDASKITRFITAGKSYFTILSTKTGQRFTFRVRKADETPGWEPAWFVALLTGPENTSSYSYMGYIGPDGAFKLTRKSRMAETAPSVVAFKWLWERVSAKEKDLPAEVEFRHANRCGRCGKTLTVPSSVDSGYGPECITMVDTSAAPRVAVLSHKVVAPPAFTAEDEKRLQEMEAAADRAQTERDTVNKETARLIMEGGNLDSLTRRALGI